MPAVKEKPKAQTLDLEKEAQGKGMAPPAKADTAKASAPTQAAAKPVVATKAAKPAPVETKPAEQVIPPGGKRLENGIVLDADGWAVNREGQRDKRWKLPYEEAQQRVRPTGSTGTPTSKADRMNALFGGHTWEIVGEQHFSKEGVKSITGSNLNRYFVIRDETGREVNVGSGELTKYVGLSLPAAARGRKPNENKEANAAAFEDEGADTAPPDTAPNEEADESDDEETDDDSDEELED